MSAAIPPLKNYEFWRRAIVEHLCLWIQMESFISINIEDRSSLFWNRFLLYYDLNRCFRKEIFIDGMGCVDSEFLQPFFYKVKVYSRSEFKAEVRELNEKFKTHKMTRPLVKGDEDGLRRNAISAASKILFNQNDDVGYIFDRRAGRGVAQLSGVSGELDFDHFHDLYESKFPDHERVLSCISEDLQRNGLSAGRLIDKFIYLLGGSMGQIESARLDHVLSVPAFFGLRASVDGTAARMTRLFGG